MAEPRSWMKPGSVVSAERVPPPTVSLASSTATERPLRASSTAAARPFGPAPTTTASYAPRAVTGSTSPRKSVVTWSCSSLQVLCLSAPAAAPAQRRGHRVEHGPGTRVVPDVLYLRPLDLRVYAGLLQGHRLVNA